MTTPPLFLLDALPSGATVVLDGPEGRHAATVKRLRPGELVQLTDGRGHTARAVVEAVHRDALDLRLTERTMRTPARSARGPGAGAGQGRPR